MSGSSTVNQSGVYGTQGVYAAGNVPGGRGYSVSWTDASGNFWLFGGAEIEGFMNDLWEYDPAGGQWRWMSGSSTVSQSGVYGTQGVYATSNVPGARYGSITWTDASGNFWLFGGDGYDSAGGGGYLNDLWEYDPTAVAWTTTTVVASSINPAPFGTSVAFTATVTSQGSGTPTGTVTFTYSITTLCNAVTLTSGAATCTYSALPAGSDAVTATYSGDAKFVPSSGTVTQTVKQASTSTGVTSSLNPSNFNQQVTFTATVTPIPDGGTVTFSMAAQPCATP